MDFRICFVLSILFQFIKHIGEKYLYHVFLNISKNQDDPVRVDLRCKKAAHCSMSAIYMIYSTAFGYYVLKDQIMMPKALGGSGDFVHVFKLYPYAEHVPYLKHYYLSVTSYHLGQLVMHFFGNHQNDFIEMGFHHLVTVNLVVGCYMINGWEGGAIISLLHDACDICGMFTKTFTQTVYDKASVFWFALLLLSWGWCRNIQLPCIIYNIMKTRDQF